MKMKFNLKKLVLCGFMLGVLTVAAALPAAALNITWPFQKVKVESVELGEYEATMVVGTTQQLRPYALPENASKPQVTLYSEDNTIITIMENGVIGALAEGTTRVVATADGVSNYYTITVTPDPSTIVTDMDLSMESTEIAVGSTVSLSVAVSPSSAVSTAQVTFTSSNEQVATVNAFGKVTGVSKGTATITAQCGDVVRTIDVTVKIPTDGIHLNTNYVVLKPGQTFTIKGSVTPASAPQWLSFSSKDKSVAKVSSGGVITAVGTGSTSIVVSNGSSSSMVTVIVNQNASSTTPEEGEGSGQTPDGNEPETSTNPIYQQISDSTEAQVVFSQAQLPQIDTDILDLLRRTGKVLVIEGDGYTLKLDGAQIQNTGNTVDTALVFTQGEKGLEFVLNNGQALPGTLEITLKDGNSGYARLYLFNEATEKWQYLNSYANDVLHTDEAGRYLLTNQTLTFIGVSWYALGAAVVVLLAIVVVYIVIKKRYWFW